MKEEPNNEYKHVLKRAQIRNIKSLKKTKPRLCDALYDGDEVVLEFKNGTESELIELDAFISLVKGAGAHSQFSG